MNFRYDSYCGLYCGACEICLVNECGNIEVKAKEWDMKLSDVKCFGCKTHQNSIYCIDCEIKLCAEAKNVEFCHECKEFACSKILDFRNDKYPHHSVVLKNLKTIKEKGLNNWLIELEKRWKCSRCGTRFTWYDEICKECGEILFNCEQEEKELEV
ncbi:MAG: DUF3795 domain-containing protein [Candidatus Lokiarchaeia archaeon]